MKKLEFIILIMFLLVFNKIQAQTIFDEIRENDISIVISLIEKEPQIISQTHNIGNTPLHNVVLVSSNPIIDYLLFKKYKH
jgi:hypothetical protein